MTAAKAAQPVHLEGKVIAATFGSAVASAGVYVLQHDTAIVSRFHGVLAAFVAVLSPPVLAFGLSYLKKHSLRADLGELGAEISGQLGLDPQPIQASAFPGTLTDPSAAVAVADPAA